MCGCNSEVVYCILIHIKHICKYFNTTSGSMMHPNLYMLKIGKQKMKILTKIRKKTDFFLLI